MDAPVAESLRSSVGETHMAETQARILDGHYEGVA